MTSWSRRAKFPGRDSRPRSCRPSPFPRGNPPAGFVTACDFNPLDKCFFGDVRRPGEEEPPKIVVPLLARQLALEVLPRLVRLDHVADAAKVNCAIAQRHVRITDADRL